MRAHRYLSLLLPVLACLPLPALAQGRDFSAVEIETTALRGSTHLLTGAGGNVVASVGEDGAFLIDDQFAPLTDKLRAALTRIDAEHGLPVRFVINTHWHGDHTGGNQNFGQAGAVIIAHDNVRERMSAEQFDASLQGASAQSQESAEAALPVVTFAEGVTLHFNDDAVRVLHVANAHTDGDALVKFETANVLHMGDTWFNGGYPFIDLDSGGSIDGVLAAVARGLTLSDADTIIVPGHGAVGDRAALAAYGKMLQGYRDAIAAMKADGQPLPEVIAAKPTAATDAELGGGFIAPDELVTAIYKSL